MFASHESRDHEYAGRKYSAPGRRVSTPDDAASPLKANDIVLLEEPDLYRFDENGCVPHGAVAGYHQKPSFSAAVPLPVEQAKYATRSVHSHRSHRSGGPAVGHPNYALHTTPYATPSAKRTASVDTIPAHFGALRAGGSVRLFTRDYVGLLFNWVLMGFIQAALTGLTWPLFGVYMNYSYVQMTAASTLIGSGWYFKFLLGFVTDNCAINRQRRKPFMLIGFGIVAVFLFAMALTHKVAWYGGPRVNGEVPAELVRNANAPSQGIRYVIPLAVVSFARLLATVACEGMMVEFAHREGEFERGRTQLWCIASRFLGEVLGGMFTALGLSSVEYGGKFAHSIPLGWYFAILGVVAFAGVAVTFYFVKEDQVPSTSQGFGSNIRRVWRFVEQRATTQLMVALFLTSCSLNTDVVEYSTIYSAWFHTDSLVRSLVGIFQATGYIITAAAFSFWFLNTNWRVLVIAGLTIAFVIQFPIELLTVWDVVRSSTLFLSKEWVANIFVAMPWIIQSIVAVEGAEPGLESTTFGFFTTICNLAGVLVGWAYNFVSISWSSESTTLTDDTDRVRWHLTYEFIAKYAMRFALAFAAIACLPRQKRHVKEIKIRGAPNLVVPVVLFVLVAALFVAAITSAIMSMFESTTCLPFAGGSGCK